jgi:hypothetical protein
LVNLISYDLSFAFASFFGFGVIFLFEFSGDGGVVFFKFMVHVSGFFFVEDG